MKLNFCFKNNLSSASQIITFKTTNQDFVLVIQYNSVRLFIDLSMRLEMDMKTI